MSTQSLTVSQLRQIATHRQLAGRSKLGKKAELLLALGSISASEYLLVGSSEPKVAASMATPGSSILKPLPPSPEGQRSKIPSSQTRPVSGPSILKPLPAKPVSSVREKKANESDEDDLGLESLDLGETRTLTKTILGNRRMGGLTAKFQAKPTFSGFMRWIDQMVYLKNMMDTARYTLEDIQSYKFSADGDVVLNMEPGVRLIYSIYNPKKSPSQAKMEKLAEKYISYPSLLFQKLYKLYVDPKHQLDPEDNSYVILT